MTIFCKIGLPGFVAPLALVAATMVPLVLSLTVVDKVGLETSNVIVGLCVRNYIQTHIVFQTKFTQIHSWTFFSHLFHIEHFSKAGMWM